MLANTGVYSIDCRVDGGGAGEAKICSGTSDSRRNLICPAAAAAAAAGGAVCSRPDRLLCGRGFRKGGKLIKPNSYAEPERTGLPNARIYPTPLYTFVLPLHALIIIIVFHCFLFFAFASLRWPVASIAHISVESEYFRMLLLLLIDRRLRSGVHDT